MGTEEVLVSTDGTILLLSLVFPVDTGFRKLSQNNDIATRYSTAEDSRQRRSDGSKKHPVQVTNTRRCPLDLACVRNTPVLEPRRTTGQE